MTGPSPVRDVSVTIDGVTYEGTYYVQCYMVYVQSPLGKNVTRLGGSRSKAFAMSLLSELVREAKR